MFSVRSDSRFSSCVGRRASWRMGVIRHNLVWTYLSVKCVCQAPSPLCLVLFGLSSILYQPPPTFAVCCVFCYSVCMDTEISFASMLTRHPVPWPAAWTSLRSCIILYFYMASVGWVLFKNKRASCEVHFSIPLSIQVLVPAGISILSASAPASESAKCSRTPLSQDRRFPMSL